METPDGRVNRVVAKHPELRCGAIKSDGVRCGMARMRGRTLCFYHDQSPEIVLRRAKARGKGVAAVRAVLRREDLPALDLSTRAGSIRFREQLIELTLTGKLNPRCAVAAAEIARKLPEDFEDMVRHYRCDRILATELPLASLADLEERWLEEPDPLGRRETSRQLMEAVSSLNFPHPALNPIDPLDELNPGWRQAPQGVQQNVT